MTLRALTTDDMYRANIPERYWPPVGFDQVPDTAPYHARIKKYLREITVFAGEGVGLFLWAEKNGSGKTALACITLRRALQAGFSGYFIGSSELKEDVLTNRMDTNDTSVRERVRTVDFLVLDDFGKEYQGQSGFVENLVETVIRERVRRKKITIITSNIGPDQIKTIYSTDLADVLKESCYTLKIPGAEAGGKNWRDAGKEKVKRLMGDT